MLQANREVRTQEVLLHAVTYLARDTHALEFRPALGGELGPFLAGAHIDLLLPNGLRRSYSLCNPQGETGRYVVAVKKAAASRGGSAYVHDNLRVGTRLEVGRPRNNFPLIEDAPHVVLIAGGIGITPIWCMIQRLVATGGSWEVHYASRTRKDAAFLADLQNLPAEAGRRVHLTFDHEPGATSLDLSAIVTGARAGSHFYACGPASMLGAFERATGAVPNEQVHVERFHAAAEPVERAPGFQIVLARSQKIFKVPENKTILDVLLDEGIDIPFSCMEGVCGSCRIGVLEGAPDHRDVVLSREERAGNRFMMVCCSGSKSERLVLDL
jgi:tetrachlorobenzoquinone reductase